MDEVLLEATQFVARCYGCASSESMSATRYEVWIGKTSKRKVAGAPKLKSLPSTSEAFEQNVRRAHFHVSVWKAALEKDPPELAQTNEASRSLLPVTISEDVALAHMDVLKAIRCGCTDQPCATAGACVELLKCHAPFSVGVMEWKSAATYEQKSSSLPKKTWTVAVMTSNCVMTELF